MTPERWRRVEQLYQAARAQAVDERVRFLKTACPDDQEVRHEVESLLAQFAAGDGVLVTGAAHTVPRITDARLMLVGQRIGGYLLQSILGAGAMGDVYRARDTKLGRDVAIKILPPAFTGDPERLARFEREARVLASLNHPNIGAIYGLEESDGIRALVLELIDGETLADRLQQGRLPVAEALVIARQIADALEAAHEKGVVHRDLKPANIKITCEGRVKVLDFGIAKLATGNMNGLGTEAASAPTITAGATEEGIVLGTAAYMSPEQARGQAVDKRTDIWASGCVLYEMLTGRPAFARGTVTDTLAAIVEREPDWRALPTATPPTIQRLLARCLDKDPKRRLHDIADARIEIDDAQSRPRSDAEVETTTDVEAASARVRLRPSPLRRVAPYAAVILAALATGFVVWRVRRPAEAPPRPIARFSIELPDQMRLSADNRAVAISPDGTHLAYVANDRLYLRALDRPGAAAIARTEAGGVGGFARAPFFSPDGQWVAFWQENQLRKVPVSGGPPVAICDVPAMPVGSSWEPDGEILFGAEMIGIMRVPATGGTPEPLIALRDGERVSNPQTLPGGKWILFQVYAAAPADQGQVVVQSRATGERRVLIKGVQDARYLPSGHLVYGRGNALLAQAFDPGRLTLSGGPVPVLDGVANAGVTNSTQPPSMQFAVSSAGTMLYVPGSAAGATALTRLVLVARDGTRSSLAEIPGMIWYPRFSPDGSRVAYGVSAGENLVDSSDLWMLHIERKASTRVTFTGNNRFLPIWTRDGARLTFADGTGATNHLLWAPADGSGRVETLLEEGIRRFPTSWSPDGHTLAFYNGGSATQTTRDIWMLHLDGDKRTTTPFVVTPFDERGAIFSPDGRWVAYVSNKSGRNELYALPYPGPGSEVAISVGGGQEPVWGPSGRELFYRHDGKLLVVRIDEDATSLRVGAPTRVFDDPYRLDTSAAQGGNTNYDISPNGRRFVMVEESGPTNPAGTQPVRLQVILNWTEELKARVPTK